MAHITDEDLRYLTSLKQRLLLLRQSTSSELTNPLDAKGTIDRAYVLCTMLEEPLEKLVTQGA